MCTDSRQPHILLLAHWDQILTNLPVSQYAISCSHTCTTFDVEQILTYVYYTLIYNEHSTLNYCKLGIGMGLWHWRNVRLQNVRLSPLVLTVSNSCINYTRNLL